jgi:hypothetical protein
MRLPLKDSPAPVVSLTRTDGAGILCSSPGPKATPLRTQLDDDPPPRDTLQLPGCRYRIFESGETPGLLIARQEHVDERPCLAISSLLS